MHHFVFFNRSILPAETALLSAYSSAALYGKGVFTTVAIYNAKPFLWEKHWRRLNENAKKISLESFDLDETAIKNALLEIAVANKITNGRARITLFDESAATVWQVAPQSKTNLLIQTADFRKIKRSMSLTVSPFLINSTSPLAGIKSCNYLENILALEAAKNRGFDEAVRLNERGEVVSACLANLFWKKDGAIFTPSLETGCLNGTTREFILENYAVRERRAEIMEFKQADEIFLTSAGIGIVKAVGDKL